MIKVIEENRDTYEVLKSEGIKYFLDNFVRLETVYVYLKTYGDEYKKYLDCPGSFVNTVYKSTKGKRDPVHYITTDLLTLYWGGWLEDLKYISDRETHHEPRISITSSIPLEETPGILKHGEEYSGFLSDWKDYREGSIKDEIIKELSEHGYIV